MLSALEVARKLVGSADLRDFLNIMSVAYKERVVEVGGLSLCNRKMTGN